MRKLFFSLLFVSSAWHVYAQSSSDTLSQQQSIQEQVVSAIKAKQNMPVTQMTLNAKQIGERYYGADIPSLLNSTPSVNSYSDNGTGIGYSYFRLRGLDQSRINTTLNGIPVNDQEGQGTYFNNFADLLSSASSIQLQRGVGTSTNGTASIAGSLNITTRELSDKPSFILHSGFGSFNTQRLSAEYQTGMLAHHFAFYGRFGDVSTDGYRQNSGTHVRSMMLSGGYFGKKSVLKFNVLTGVAESKLSYTGNDAITLNANPKYNPFVNNERDAFRQNFYQLQYSYQINQYSGFTASAYYVQGNAPRFQYFLDGMFNTYKYMNMPDAIIGTDTFTTTDAIGSYRLNQSFYGSFANYYFKKGRLDLNAGLHANAFTSEHFMEVNWARLLPSGIKQDHQAYFNTGYKNEMNAYLKASYSVNDKWLVFGDFQIRNAVFKYKGKDGTFHRDTFGVEDMDWWFFNPKVGLRFTMNSSFSFYAMAGMTSREPTRSDYFSDEYPYKNIQQKDLRPEEVIDFELGLNFNSNNLSLNANLFNMDFTNQLINTGKLNAVGTPLTANVSKSNRYGFELDFVWKLHPKIWLTNSSMFMQNSIKSYTQYYDSAGAYIKNDSIVYANTKALLTPDLIINQGIKFLPVQWFNVELNARYVAKQFLDNTMDDKLTIKDYMVADLKCTFQLKKWVNAGEPQLTILCNNLFDLNYTPSGNTTNNLMDYSSGTALKGTTGLYFPAATRNFMATLTWKF